MTFPPIYVLRHGETEWNAEGRWQGALNSPLTVLGRDQAARQRDVLSSLGLELCDVRVSPQGRAIETAEIVLSRAVAAHERDQRLREIEVGQWTGKLRSELVAGPQAITEDTPDGPLSLYDHAPEGEGFTALKTRCAAFLASLEQPTICITHGITSRMLRILALRRPPRELGDLPGGQGVVHVVEDGQHRTLPEGLAEDATGF